MKNIHSIKVVFGDTDAAGIVFYPNFYRWMDQAAHELIGKAVLPVSKLQTEKNIVLPLLETYCQYKAPLFFEDQIEIHTEVIEMKEKIFKLEHVFKRDGKTVASGYELRAWASTESGAPKAIPIPDEVRGALIGSSVEKI